MGCSLVTDFCQGAFLKNRPLDPQKTFNYQKLLEVQKPFLEKVSG